MAKLKLPSSNVSDPVQVTPAVPVLEETYDATISSSTEITLNAGTTLIEVAATGTRTAIDIVA